jgi:SAM-dependent methyltransferase
VDAVVQVLVSATCGIAYKDAAGALSEYPVPALPLPEGHGRALLDVGCNWGRWTIAAARKGYRAIGIDPQLGAVMAARRVARQLGVEITFVCADARFLPFADGAIDTAFSYSVLQHFSRADCLTALREIGRVLKSGGTSKVQMANALGLRSAYHIARRSFREPKGFEVRYYPPGDLLTLFDQQIGKSTLLPDCFLGLGLQATDHAFVLSSARAAIAVSEAAKAVCGVFPPLRRLADSVYIESVKA